MSVIYYKYLEAPIGRLLLCSTERGLCRIGFDRSRQQEEELEELEQWARLRIAADSRLLEGGFHIEEAEEQLRQYFAGERSGFSVSLDLHGTPFQQQVWQSLAKIPYGEVRSYKQIAQNIGSPKAVRAVGGANNRNPVPVIIPCHRVIGASGDMVGYAGGLTIKQMLLELEGYQLPLTSLTGVKL
ncbi:MAG: [Fe-S]-binding protein [Paenibacillaceae bacterium]|jgi:O-6-methylguanine DNA methyltransferase|nr:[Fe-S]-binding protein [Paenibacillaceae bacterium]